MSGIFNSPNVSQKNTHLRGVNNDDNIECIQHLNHYNDGLDVNNTYYRINNNPRRKFPFTTYYFKFEKNFFDVDYGNQSLTDNNMCFYLSITKGNKSNADKLKKKLRKFSKKNDKGININDYYGPDIYAEDTVVEAYAKKYNTEVVIYTGKIGDIFGRDSEDKGIYYIISTITPNTKNFKRVYLHLIGLHYTRLYIC